MKRVFFIYFIHSVEINFLSCFFCHSALPLRVRFLHLADKQLCAYVGDACVFVCVPRGPIRYILQLTDDAIKLSLSASCRHVRPAVPPPRRLLPCCTFSKTLNAVFSHLFKIRENSYKYATTKKEGMFAPQTARLESCCENRGPSLSRSSALTGETATPLICKCGISTAKSWCHGEWLSPVWRV